MRGYGNFQAPGVNLVGNITYRDQQAAIFGAQTLTDVRRFAFFISLMTNLGVGGGVAPEIRTKAFGNSVMFASGIDASFASTLLAMLHKLLTPGSGGLF